MGYLEDINTIVKTAASAKKTLDSTKHKSIARGALDGTLQFPCLVSDAIPIDMASVLAKTFERVYASFVQTYLSLNNTMNISVDKTPSEFLQKFHKNIKLESTYEDLYKENCTEADEYFDALMERIYDGTTKAYINESENQLIVFNFSDKLNREVFESHKAMLEQSLADIDFTPFPNIGNSPFYEAIGNGDINLYRDTKAIDAGYDLTNTGINFGVGLINKSIDQGLNRLNQKAKFNNDVNLQNLKDANALDREKFKMQYGGMEIPSLLKDTDVKKLNDMQPYNMQVRLMAVNDENQFVQFVDFIVGIKVVLHNIKSEEMIVNLQNVLQNRGKLFNFIRWTTGEKSLFKDLIFRINDIKLDVANRSKGTSRWWLTLKRLKDTSKAQAAFFSRNQVVPNSTMIISSFDADAIEKKYGFSLKDPKIARRIMDTLFLMNFVIVDNNTNTVEVLYDQETSYQTYALETLEREVSMNSNKLGKELTRMISR